MQAHDTFNNWWDNTYITLKGIKVSMFWTTAMSTLRNIIYLRLHHPWMNDSFDRLFPYTIIDADVCYVGKTHYLVYDCM